MSKDITQQLEEITDAIRDIDAPHDMSIGFDTETFNMMSIWLGELVENTKRIANALEKKEEA